MVFLWFPKSMVDFSIDLSGYLTQCFPGPVAALLPACDWRHISIAFEDSEENVDAVDLPSAYIKLAMEKMAQSKCREFSH